MIRQNDGLMRTGAALQRGRTLVEIMIGMVLGLMVLGTVMSTVVNTSVSSRTQDNLGKLGEELAMRIEMEDRIIQALTAR